MENAILLYLLKISVSLLLFSILYILVLKKDTFVKTRRFYFIFALTFSLIYPLLNFELPVRNEPLVIPSYWLSQVEIGPATVVNAEEGLSNKAILLIVIASISVLLLCRFIMQISMIIRLRMVNKQEIVGGYRIVNLSESALSPFSFFNWIFINQSTLESGKLSEILTHEYAHVHQKHSIDVLLSELFCIFFWWNPLSWFIRREIKVNLEYLADKEVLENGCNSLEYQYMLLNTLTNNKEISLINNFNVSQLKKRITMMNKKQSSAVKSVKYLLALPISFALVLGNTVQASELANMSLQPSIPFVTQDFQQPKDSAKVAIFVADRLNGKVIDVKQTSLDQKDGKPFTSVDQMPTYPGGDQAMFEFIKTNLKYPKSAQDASVEGRVIIRFVVDEDGAIKDAAVLRGIDRECDAEALRTINAMPKWNPGKENGKVVPVYFTIPIAFNLTADGKEKKASSFEAMKNTLVIIDGTTFEADKVSLSNIDPSSIDKIEVVKDPAKMAAYGDAAKGKDGVLIITTKK